MGNRNLEVIPVDNPELYRMEPPASTMWGQIATDTPLKNASCQTLKTLKPRSLKNRRVLDHHFLEKIPRGILSLSLSLARVCVGVSNFVTVCYCATVGSNHGNLLNFQMKHSHSTGCLSGDVGLPTIQLQTNLLVTSHWFQSKGDCVRNVPSMSIAIHHYKPVPSMSIAIHHYKPSKHQLPHHCVAFGERWWRHSHVMSHLWSLLVDSMPAASSLDQCCQAAGRLNRFQQLANFFLFRQLWGLPQGPMAARYSSMQLGTWETHGNTADRRSKWVRCSEPQMFSLGQLKVLCLGATQNSHTKISALCHLESSRLKACEESHHSLSLLFFWCFKLCFASLSLPTHPHQKPNNTASDSSKLLPDRPSSPSLPAPVALAAPVIISAFSARAPNEMLAQCASGCSTSTMHRPEVKTSAASAWEIPPNWSTNVGTLPIKSEWCWKSKFPSFIYPQVLSRRRARCSFRHFTLVCCRGRQLRCWIHGSHGQHLLGSCKLHQIINESMVNGGTSLEGLEGLLIFLFVLVDLHHWLWWLWLTCYKLCPSWSGLSTWSKGPTPSGRTSKLRRRLVPCDAVGALDAILPVAPGFGHAFLARFLWVCWEGFSPRTAGESWVLIGLFFARASQTFALHRVLGSNP